MVGEAPTVRIQLVRGIKPGESVPPTRSFDGKIYHAQEIFTDKRDAHAMKSDIRAQGHFARVVLQSRPRKMYVVYWRSIHETG